MNPIERRLAILQHKSAIKKLSESTSPNMKKSFNASLDAKRERWAKRHQEEVEKAAGELLKSQAAKLAATPPAAAAPPVAAKAPPAPLAPKAPAPPVVATITASEFVASQNSDGPRMTRSEFNKLTERQKKRLADSGGRIVPDAAAPTKAKPSFSHLNGLARAQAVAKWEASEKAKNATR